MGFTFSVHTITMNLSLDPHNLRQNSTFTSPVLLNTLSLSLYLCFIVSSCEAVSGMKDKSASADLFSQLEQWERTRSYLKAPIENSRVEGICLKFGDR